MGEEFQLPGLDGKVALITGAARGQGRSHAVRLAQCGVDLILLDICADIDGVPYKLGTREELDETARLVEAEGQRAFATAADVRDFDAVKTGVDAGVAALGRLDIVVANAGVVVQELGVPGWEVPDGRYRAVVDTNLNGVWHTLKAAIPAVIAGGRGGSIVLISSTAGLRGMAEIPDYTASKHGVVGLMRSFAAELAPHSIRVNTVHPTGVSTPMIENDMMQGKLAVNPDFISAFANLLPIATLQPTDISNAVLWLASDAAKYLTSVSLPVDAGFSQK